MGDYAFQYCVFVQPDLGDALVNLGAYAFAWCPNLEIVIFPRLSGYSGKERILQLSEDPEHYHWRQPDGPGRNQLYRCQQSGDDSRL